MKLQKNRRYFTIAVYAFGVIAASIIFFFILLYPGKLLGGVRKIISVLAPIIVGFVIAFVLNPLMNLFEKKVFEKLIKSPKRSKLRRALSVICTYIIFLGIIVLFFMLIIPALVESVTDLINNIQGYYNAGIEFMESTLRKSNISSQFLASFNDIGTKIVNYVIDAMKSLLPKLYGVTVSITGVIKNIVVGFAFSVYMLFSKELFADRTLKLMTIYMKPSVRIRTTNIARLTSQTFSKYLSGYILDSTIVGIICYLVMIIFKFPYPALISVIIGVTNMIPIFGPAIGAIPSILLILMVNPWNALFFGIFIIALQQIDGNIICPRIIGQKVGLSAFWVMVAIVVGGSLFGIIGMLIGVPTFAVIYTLMRSLINRKLNRLDAEETNEV